MATPDQLAEAEAAYHELVTGKSARVVVDANGERVEFVAANLTKLYLYIQSMRAELGTATNRVSGPAGFVF